LWSQATHLYRDELNQPDKALDAALRLLASDLRNRDALAQIEDSVTQLGQWPRLSHVFDRLIKAATHDSERTELLVRYADLLEQRAGAPDEALNLILQACALSPDDEMLLAHAEKLAVSCDRSADLLAMCDQQAGGATDPAVQVEWLLRGARFASATAEDRSATNAYLEAALSAARTDGSLWERCVSLAQRLDAKATEIEHAEQHSHLLALIAAHRRVAERNTASIGVTLLRRASRLVEEKLGDERAAFDLLRLGATLYPLDENMYDSLLERAEATGHLDALDAHLARGVDEALDPRTAASLLARRARLLEGPLGRPDDAANVYSKLLQLRPDDHPAASKLRDSLRRARRFQDLLVVIHKQTLRAKTVEEKIELLKETAQVWELDLRNRWEAVDAWGKVLELAPEDGEALRAMGRLDRRSLPPPSGRARRAAATSAPAVTAPPASPRPPSAPPAVKLPSRAAPNVPAQASEDSIDLETLDEHDLEPVPVQTARSLPPRRPTPPPPPPQALQTSNRPKPKSSVPPPPPPPSSKPRGSE
jgi:tetratricopeptide (TPR) repeat protein